MVFWPGVRVPAYLETVPGPVRVLLELEALEVEEGQGQGQGQVCQVLTPLHCVLELIRVHIVPH